MMRYQSASTFIACLAPGMVLGACLVGSADAAQRKVLAESFTGTW